MIAQVTVVAISGPSQKGRIYPQLRNDRGFAKIRIGTRDFECIGQSPPQDHPHIYLEMGQRDEIHCPYCGTLFQFDGSLKAFAAIPSESVFTAH